MGNHNSSVISSLQRGDLVEFERGGDIINYSHWAVFIGDGRIIHFKPSIKEQKVEEDDLDRSIIRTARLKRIDVLSSESCSSLAQGLERSQFSRDEIVKRAESRLGETGYHLVTNNCEHFAIWCAFDKKISYQVENMKDIFEKAEEVIENLEDEIMKYFEGKRPKPTKRM